MSKLVEKGKSAFTGPEIQGKTLGVIGLGAIGILVANAAKSLGMTVYGYDPFLSVDSAWNLSRSVNHAQSLDEIFATCDYITLHVPLTPETKNLVGTASLQKMKDGVRILNFARGDLVCLLYTSPASVMPCILPESGQYPQEPDGRIHPH